MAIVKPVPIVALDVPDMARALELVERLGDSCEFYKVGGELFTASGPAMVEALRLQGKRVFLDLKFHTSRTRFDRLLFQRRRVALP